MKHLGMNSPWLRLLIFLLAVCTVSTAAVAQTTGSITGKVFDGETPVAGISVGVFDTNEIYKTMSTTDANGEYALSGLQLGTYKIYFSTYGTKYIAQWYNNAATFDDAQPINLTTENPNFDVGLTQLATGGTISGTITEAAAPGGSIADVTVQAFDASDSAIWFSGKTNAEGVYSITGVRSGTYKIRFRAFGTNYITAWYSSVNENHAVPDEGDAESVAVTGVPVLIDAKLTAGGAISGKVTIQETGAFLSGARVNVYSSPDNILKGYATTGEQGIYTVSGLPADSSYKVQFFERVVNNAGAGINKWYNEQSDFVSADLVDIGNNAVDAVFSGAVISGTVTSQKNGLLPNVTVKAYDSVGKIAASSQVTGEDGVYKIEGLKRGNYRLYFEMPAGSQYASEWHSDKSNMAQANAVVINSLGDRLTINAVMQPPSKAAKLIPIYKRLLLKKRCYIINGVRVCR
ncbi:MSCRAMM family protein [Candidatus Electronema sp. JC]|uniref:MSCRAMM family protein n=1 Tax=Candidatus Electronema sp. JC TaxID=3401570 RepID=UPI003B43B5A7